MGWKRMTVMLAGSAVVFGGVYGLILYKNYAIAQYFANQPKPVVNVTAAEARKENWTSTVPAVGTLRAGKGVDVTSSVAGVVQEILFKSGDVVKAGQPLVRLDSDVDEANLKAAEAELGLARSDYERSAGLTPRQVISQATLDQRLYDMRAKEAHVAALKAQIAKKTITAPFDGRIGIAKVDVGQYLDPGTPIVTLQNLETLKVEFGVTQRDIALISPGSTIRVTADAFPGKVFEGTVTSLEPRVDPATGLVKVEGTLPNPQSELLAGMFVNVEVELDQTKERVVVPSSAVSYNLYGDFVFVIEQPKEGQEHPTVRRAMVETGERRGADVAILKGVEPGDLVVTSGQLKLQNGMQVAVDNEPLPQPAVAAQNY